MKIFPPLTPHSHCRGCEDIVLKEDAAEAESSVFCGQGGLNSELLNYAFTFADAAGSLD
jgi:hypothetical protein